MKQITLSFTDDEFALICQEAFDVNKSEDDFLADTLRSLFPAWE